MTREEIKTQMASAETTADCITLFEQYADSIDETTKKLTDENQNLKTMNGKLALRLTEKVTTDEGHEPTPDDVFNSFADELKKEYGV